MQDKINKYKTLKQEILASNPYWEYQVDDYVYPDGSVGKYYFVKSRGASMVIATDADGKFLMTKQFRYLNRKISIEFPGGGRKPGATPLETASEELQEETKFAADEIIQIGEYNPFNGVTDEITSVYFARGLNAVECGHDDSEEIKLIKLTKTEINQKIRAGEIWDGMSLAAWAIFSVSEFAE